MPTFLTTKKKQLFIIVPFIVILMIMITIILILSYKYFFSDPSFRSLSKADIEQLSQTVKLNEKDRKKILGTFNERTVMASYHCSDICPDYGDTSVIYKDVNEKECQTLGGKVLWDLGFGGYIGCHPE